PSAKRNIPRNCSCRFPETRRCVQHRENTLQPQRRPDFRASPHRCRLSASCHFKWMIEILGIVKNALARGAGDDLVVPSNFLEYLRTDSDLADFTHFISSGGDGDSTPMLPNALILCDEVRRYGPLNFLPLFQIRLEGAGITFVLFFELFSLRVHFGVIV